LSLARERQRGLYVERGVGGPSGKGREERFEKILVPIGQSKVWHLVTTWNGEVGR
jgi:hypothetical protein